MSHRYPFSAVVGQAALKQALLLALVNPGVGGLLIRGEKGTAKSTTVRAAAALLPWRTTTVDCPYGCDPRGRNGRCEGCASREHPPTVRRSAPFVTLPLGATEDRVAGGIDFDFAVRRGVRRLQPGLLAAANGGALYVDEVNLLDDHLVDLILDAAVSGENRVEREGVSARHPTRFLLVGTMNPEEGALRPGFLDRFGLCVDVVGERDPNRRVRLMIRREAFDADPAGFIARFGESERRLAEAVALGRKRLSGVAVPRAVRDRIVRAVAESGAVGHRAELVMERAARARAALMGRAAVSSADVAAAAPLALAHRRREAAPPEPPSPRSPQPESKPPSQAGHASPDSLDPPPSAGEGGAETDSFADLPPNDEENASPEPDVSGFTPEEREERVFAAGVPFRVRPLESPRDRVVRRGSGRRSRSRTDRRRGRYVRAVPARGNGDIALDATLRAAAPHQVHRRNGNPNGDGLAVHLRPSDIRERVRERRTGQFLLFLVDASGSMGARGRMIASKGAVLSLLLDAYQKRDRVGMISFRGREATVNLPPTGSVELAARRLDKLPVGGRTPLSAGLVQAHRLLETLRRRDPAARPITVVVTDGKANAALREGAAVDEALALARRLAEEGRSRFVVVDTESEGLFAFGLARRLAEALAADYFRVSDLNAGALLDVVKGTRS